MLDFGWWILDVIELLDLGKAFSNMEFEQCRSLTALGYGFFDDFARTVNEETLLRAGDGGPPSRFAAPAGNLATRNERGVLDFGLTARCA